MTCKQCGESFSMNQPHDIWEVRRQFVQPDATGTAPRVMLEDAGVFCSRSCIQEYLKGGANKSGVFGLGNRKPLI